MQRNFKKPRVSLLIVISFLITGVALFVTSVFSDNQIFSSVGLGLTFFGAILLLITPKKLVESSFLVSSTLPAYLAMDRMIKNLNLKREAYNIPSCSGDASLPEHLKCLNEMVTFIPVEQTEESMDIESLPPDEYLLKNHKNLLINIAEDKFLTENPKGLLLPSPGLSLLEKIERKHKNSLDRISLSKLDNELSYLFHQLHLCKEIKMAVNANQVTLQINNSFYDDLYSQKNDLTSVKILGCPLVSAVACAIAKSVGKPTLIQAIKTSSNYKTITVNLEIVSGMFEEQEKFVDDEKIELRQNELLFLIKASMRIIDLSFDILFNLNNQRINWEQLDYYFRGLGVNLVFIGRSMPSLNLDFQKLASAVKSRAPMETSKEVSDLLKNLFEYFGGLNLNDDYIEKVPNFQSSRATIEAYYTLNDLMLGKIVGDKDKKTESQQLENILQTLTTWSAFRIKTGELVESIENINRLDSENDSDNNIENIRQIFKKHLNL